MSDAGLRPTESRTIWHSRARGRPKALHRQMLLSWFAPTLTANRAYPNPRPKPRSNKNFRNFTSVRIIPMGVENLWLFRHGRQMRLAHLIHAEYRTQAWRQQLSARQ